MRPSAKLGSLMVVLGCALAAQNARAFSGPLDFLEDPLHFFLHGAQGYLGIYFKDVGSDAAALKLKNPHRPEVIVVDHDAPAAKAGLKVHDVILQMNGSQVANCDQLRHMLRKQPPGRTVNLVISRDGSSINVSVQLVDRVQLEQQAWSQHYSVQEPADTQSAAASKMPRTPMDSSQSFLSSNPSAASRFLGTLIPSYLYVGADVNPVRTQLADYFGVTSGTGLLVENVDNGSPASRAGLRAGDVILKVNSVPMATRSAWFKAIRGNRGRLVQVTIMRNKQPQVLTMAAGKLKNGG